MVEEWNVGPVCSQIHRLILQNRAQKCSEAQTLQRTTVKSGEAGATTGLAATTAHGSDHGQAMVASGLPTLLLPGCCILVYLLVCGFCLGSSFLRPFGLLLQSFMTWFGPKTFSNLFRLLNLNSAKTLKISKTTHSTRNRGYKSYNYSF